jgi:hypothetical protein
LLEELEVKEVLQTDSLSSSQNAKLRPIEESIFIDIFLLQVEPERVLEQRLERLVLTELEELLEAEALEEVPLVLPLEVGLRLYHYITTLGSA